MAISLYDISVASYLQILGGVAGYLEKGLTHCAANGIDLDGIVETRLYPDMLPFRFQIVSVVHHSLGAMRGMEVGEFKPPSRESNLDYAGLQELVAQARSGLEAYDTDAVNAMEGREVVFRVPGLEVPFIAENFVTSFSLPNLHFHATTAYDILRMNGVPIGKRDFVGQLRGKS